MKKPVTDDQVVRNYRTTQSMRTTACLLNTSIPRVREILTRNGITLHRVGWKFRGKDYLYGKRNEF